jgi:uncharacterized membrane protein YphA (DoxX/SURF4 family)
LQAGTMVAVALIVGFVWLWFDREERHDRVVREIVRVILRFCLGASMLNYGFAKILHQQMGAPGFYRLFETFGRSSPMGLLWTFMGYSRAYGAYIGWAEAIGGFLLFFRRTTSVGALLAAVICANILVINLCFDVPVKLYSAHLLTFAIVLAAPDLRALFDLMILRRPAVPSSLGRPWSGPRLDRVRLVAKLLAVGWILWAVPGEELRDWATIPAVAKSAFYGLYDVENFRVDGVDQPAFPLSGDRWRRMWIDARNNVTLQMTNENTAVFRLESDVASGKIALIDKDSREDFSYTQPSPDELRLEGKLDGHILAVQFRRANDRDLLLLNRGFHWITERPVNR